MLHMSSLEERHNIFGAVTCRNCQEETLVIVQPDKKTAIVENNKHRHSKTVITNCNT